MKKVLIVGASGSLGRGLLNQIKRTHSVTATYTNNSFMDPDVEVVQVDVRDPLSMVVAGSIYDAVVLIAGAMPATMKGYEPQNYIDTNVTGALNVLEYCRKSNIKKLIYVMTFSDVAHKFYSGIPILSDDERGPNLTGDHAVYAITKIAALDLIEHYHQEYGIQTIAFRIPTVYCPDTNFDYHVDGIKRTKAYVQMIRSIVNNAKVELWGNPNNSKDMPYIKDFARLIDMAITHETAQGMFNAGTGHPVSLQRLLNSMIRVFSPENEVEIVEKPDKPSQPNFTFDMSKTAATFGYEPMWDIDAMLTDIRDTLGIDKFKI